VKRGVWAVNAAPVCETGDVAGCVRETGDVAGSVHETRDVAGSRSPNGWAATVD